MTAELFWYSKGSIYYSKRLGSKLLTSRKNNSTCGSPFKHFLSWSVPRIINIRTSEVRNIYLHDGGNTNDKYM
jgi:hypothetical protein